MVINYHIIDSSQNGVFVWKSLYVLHSYSSIKEILKNKKMTISKIKENVFENYSNLDLDYKLFNHILEVNNIGWAKDYFDQELDIKDSKIYTETFKFISNVMQYKIPFFINFFVGVFEIYMKKNGVEQSAIGDINSLEIASYFENGNLEPEYQEMYDFGVPLEMINRMKKHEGTISNLLLDDNNTLDLYEKSILRDYLNLIS